MNARIALLLAVAAGTAACGGTERHEKVERPAATVTVAVARTTVAPQQFEMGGTIRARTVAVLSSRIIAPIVEVRAVPGQRVRRGETLVVLDSRELEANRARADAGLAAASEGATVAKADEQAAASALALATVTHKRISTLRDKNSATPGELDQAVANLRSAEARAAGAAARRVEAGRGIEAATAALRAATVAQSYASIAAPFDGTVTAKSADPGNMAAPGMPLLTMEDERQYRLEVSLDASRVAHVAEGAHVPVTVDGIGATLEGTIAEISRAVDPTAQAVTVKIDLPAAAGLRTGLYGRASLAGSPRKGISVPESAVLRRGQLAVVFVDDGGTARMRLVHTGTPVSGLVPVLAGIVEGDRVIVDPPRDLTDGTPLKVSVATAAADRPGRLP